MLQGIRIRMISYDLVIIWDDNENVTANIAVNGDKWYKSDWKHKLRNGSADKRINGQ